MKYFLTWLWLHTKVLLLGGADRTVGHHMLHDVEYRYARWRNGAVFNHSNGQVERLHYVTVSKDQHILALALEEAMTDCTFLKLVLGTRGKNYYLRAVPYDDGALVAVFPAYHNSDLTADQIRTSNSLQQAGNWASAWNGDDLFQFIYCEGYLVAPSALPAFYFRQSSRPLLVFHFSGLHVPKYNAVHA